MIPDAMIMNPRCMMGQTDNFEVKTQKELDNVKTPRFL